MALKALEIIRNRLREATEKKSGTKEGKPEKPPKKKEENPPQKFMPLPDTCPVHFEPTTGRFYSKNAFGEYQCWDKDTLRVLLRSKGFCDKTQLPNGLTFLETEMLRIVNEQSVNYAGPLGGYPAGIHEQGGLRLLVTRGPQYVSAKRGPWPLLKKFISDLFGDEAKYFVGWIRHADSSLRAGYPFAPGQLLAIAGPGGSGKSFFQSLITHMIGGRVSSPYKYMAGKTDFNAEIFGAEHGLIGDQNHRYDKMSRRAFASAIKELVVNPEGYIHGKHKSAITLSSFVRLSMTLNDNPQALLVLPELESDVADKILLLRGRPCEFPFPSRSFPTRADFFNAIRKEIPAFIHAVRMNETGKDISDRRYGVVSYHSPELVSRMNSLSSEWKLWSLIEMYLWSDDIHMRWSGTAAELERVIRDKAKGENLSPLFFYPGACGQYLATLAKQLKGQITVTKGPHNLNRYQIERFDLSGG